MVEVHRDWNGIVVVQSFFLAFIGAYSAVTLAEQHRIAATLKAKFFNQQSYLVLMSFAIGGAAIWCMHFVGMQADTLFYYDETDTRRELEESYVVGLTIVSLVACIVCVFVGLLISTRDKMFVRDRAEIFKIIIEEAKNDSLEKIRNKNYLRYVALFRDIGPLVVGGIITGCGVCIMHYVGMTAMVANVSFQFHPGIVFASVVIAVVAATAAYWILFRLLALYPNIEALRIASSIIMAVAVNGMHYTGMAAVSYTLNDNPDRGHIFQYTINREDAVAVAILSSLSFNWLVGACVQADLRGWYLYLRPQLKSARKMLSSLHERYKDDYALSQFQMKDTQMCSSFENVPHEYSAHSLNEAKVHAEEQCSKIADSKA